MDLDDSSPDEKEFPGLYERNASKGKKGTGDENESNSSENLKKSSEKLKSDKKAKDRQSYEVLGGGESEEDDTETKLFRSPSKSKKLKTFKFPSSTKKEKREKSVEKDSTDKKVKEDSKADKKKAKKEKKSKSSSLTSEVLEIGGAQNNFD